MSKKYIVMIVLAIISMPSFAQTPITSVIEGVFSAIGIPTRQSRIDAQRQERQKQIDDYNAAQQAERDKKAQDASDLQARLDSYKSHGWMYATENSKKDSFYISGEDIRVNGDIVSVWVKTKSNKPYTLMRGKTARSSIMKTDYDCKDRTYTVTDGNHYSGSDGNGSLIISASDIPDWSPRTENIIPGTAGSRLLNFVCALGKPINQPPQDKP